MQHHFDTLAFCHHWSPWLPWLLFTYRSIRHSGHPSISASVTHTHTHAHAHTHTHSHTNTLTNTHTFAHVRSSHTAPRTQVSSLRMGTEAVSTAESPTKSGGVSTMRKAAAVWLSDIQDKGKDVRKKFKWSTLTGPSIRAETDALLESLNRASLVLSCAHFGRALIIVVICLLRTCFIGPHLLSVFLLCVDCIESNLTPATRRLCTLESCAREISSCFYPCLVCASCARPCVLSFSVIFYFFVDPPPPPHPHTHTHTPSPPPRTPPPPPLSKGTSNELDLTRSPRESREADDASAAPRRESSMSNDSAVSTYFQTSLPWPLLQALSNYLLLLQLRAS
jgi:hypothetical protein